MTDDSIRDAVRSALDAQRDPATPASELAIAIAKAAVRQGETAVSIRVRSRSLWWLCAAAALVAFACVGLARREQRLSAMSVPEVSWSL